MDLQKTSIEVVKGVGPARRRLLEKLGVCTVADALRYYPRAYSDRRLITKVLDLQPGTSALVVGKVTSVLLRRYSWRNSVLTVKVSDGAGDLYAVWFNQPYLVRQFSKGKRIALFGKPTISQNGKLQMTSPEVEILPDEETSSPHLFRIVPVYSATEELSAHILRNVMHRVVEQFSDRLRDFLPSAVRERLQLAPLSQAIRNVHFPETWTALEEARRRLIFQELFLLQMGAALRRKIISAAIKDRAQAASRSDDRADRFLSRLPFCLTDAQRRSIEEIRRDLSSSQPMNRLLHGDVGCGKTIVAVWAILQSLAGGCQTALMAPTELLAQQHYAEISRLLSDEDCRIVLLVGSAASKESLYDEIAEGHADLVIGTQALIQDWVRFKRLGLLVIDEQHRFGVVQRLKLYEKGDCPDVLVMSATPIPRTLCQTLYGDMDVSVIDELPPGRLPIQTECYPSSKLPAAYERLRKIISSGNRAYVVCPLIEENEASERLSAVETCRRLSRETLLEMRVGLLHGSMDSVEKEDAIRKFRAGLLDILVTTTVIEIGIDVPDAAVILITNGECFGLSQLHQMRGRVGRGCEQGYCIVVADPKTDAARERLRIFESTNDGFKIAAEDLRLRGVGEFFGTRQHGISEVAANILENQDMLHLARKEAFAIVSGDIPVSPQEKKSLDSELRISFGDRFRFGFV